MSNHSEPRPPAAGMAHRGSRALRYARLVQRFRWSVVIGWLVLVVATTLLAPAFGSGGDQLANVIPLDSPAIKAELRSIDAFGYPLSSRTVVVQRNPDGLSPYTQAESVLDAISIDQSPQAYPLLGALPVTNTAPFFPGTGETNTAVLTYLFMNPTSAFDHQQRAAEDYVQRFLGEPDDHVVGVAGSVPARAQQAGLVSEGVPLLELATVGAIALLVALNFKSVVAPLVALTASAMAFLVTMRIAGIVGVLIGVAVPAELEPLLVALLLGIVTDYTIFYVAALAARRRKGDDWDEAVAQAIAAFTPIIIAAGVTVAAGTAALLAARSDFFRSFGPPMALSVLVGVAVSVTLVPALLSVLGHRVFLPSRPQPGGQGADWEVIGPVSRVTTVGRLAMVGAYPRLGHQGGRGVVESMVDRLTRPRIAAVVLLACVAVLTAASLPLTHIRLGVGFTESLPSDNSVRVASRAAGAAFAPGITSPTTILLEGAGVATHVDELIHLQRLIERQQGVAAVLGPAQNLTRQQLGVFLAQDGEAARMLVVLQHDPLEALAIQDVGTLRDALPDLLRESGLAGIRASLVGDTALAEGLVRDTGNDLVRIALAALVVNLLLLVVFLRALVAPLYLLACSTLALTAALGTATWVFQDLLHQEGLTFYVPFAAAVLLVALGSDYNIFGVGHVWEAAKRLPLIEALRVSVPESTRAITAAGVTLAVSFGLLAVIPLRAFRELAVTMTVGIILDAVVVRSLLVPTLLTLVGPVSGWPGPNLRTARSQHRTAEALSRVTAPTPRLTSTDLVQQLDLPEPVS
ncbi:MAG: MMPL family transporter [Pedococcus sp.]